ncbi:Oidioi.mRNA.OKI2018_I69.XSR.g16431.t1.cds [Oikopleura dioica]|uniref:Oidioi.mRNA.OKI2018_I69.XSR.g16431.t1.cds n=1 Tax=Oikopleura dioica TaxID=34765 RepID=A0ABN7SK38_OIKDI|nr:Oidioi.mRNA.OKI2018_I69.XSR.g16431.t1.cds [Oikopleura dioica]
MNVVSILQEVRNIDVNQMLKDMNGGHHVHQSFWWTYETPSDGSIPLETLSYMLYLSITCLITCVVSVARD